MSQDSGFHIRPALSSAFSIAIWNCAKQPAYEFNFHHYTKPHLECPREDTAGTPLVRDVEAWVDRTWQDVAAKIGGGES